MASTTLWSITLTCFMCRHPSQSIDFDSLLRFVAGRLPKTSRDDDHHSIRYKYRCVFMYISYMEGVYLYIMIFITPCSSSFFYLTSKNSPEAQCGGEVVPHAVARLQQYKWHPHPAMEFAENFNWKEGITGTSCPGVLQPWIWPKAYRSVTLDSSSMWKNIFEKNYSRCFGIRPLPITHPLKNGGESNIKWLRRNCTFFIFFSYLDCQFRSFCVANVLQILPIFLMFSHQLGTFSAELLKFPAFFTPERQF